MRARSKSTVKKNPRKLKSKRPKKGPKRALDEQKGLDLGQALESFSGYAKADRVAVEFDYPFLFLAAKKSAWLLFVSTGSAYQIASNGRLNKTAFFKKTGTPTWDHRFEVLFKTLEISATGEKMNTVLFNFKNVDSGGLAEDIELISDELIKCLKEQISDSKYVFDLTAGSDQAEAGTTPEHTEESLTADAIAQARKRFRDKFGRDPKKNESLYFSKHSKKTPLPLTQEEIDENKVAVSAALEEANVDPAFVYAYQKTGMILTEENLHLWSEGEIQEWNSAIAEYQAISTNRHLN